MALQVAAVFVCDISVVRVGKDPLTTLCYYSQAAAVYAPQLSASLLAMASSAAQQHPVCCFLPHMQPTHGE